MVIVVMDVGIIILSIIIIVIVGILVANKCRGNPNASACTQTNSSTALGKNKPCAYEFGLKHFINNSSFHPYKRTSI